MTSPGLDKTLESIAQFNELSSLAIKASNEVNSKLPKLLANTSRAYEAFSKLNWETLQAKALDEARLKTIEDYAALIKKKPQDVIWSGLVSAIGDGVLEDKTGRVLEQPAFLSWHEAKSLFNCSQQEDTQATVFIPEAKRHTSFAEVAKAYAAWLGLKVVFIKEFSKVLELVKEKLATLNSSFVDALRANENAPPDFMLSYSLTANAPPKNNGKPFSALLLLSRVSDFRKGVKA
jgi:hypothetical protein